MTNLLEAIIRFPDPADVSALSRAVFALALADHRPLTITIVCQRFSPLQRQAVDDALTPLIAIAGDVGLQVLNHSDRPRRNAKAALLNLGLSASRARYLALLTHHDVIYPEAHRLLIAELVASDAAIAFGGLLEASVCREGLVPITTAKRPIIPDKDQFGLLQKAAAQLPGAVLDRHRIAPEHLTLDEASSWPEHDFLVRLRANYRSSIRLQHTILGECARDHSGKKSGTER